MHTNDYIIKIVQLHEYCDNYTKYSNSIPVVK